MWVLQSVNDARSPNEKILHMTVRTAYIDTFIFLLNIFHIVFKQIILFSFSFTVNLSTWPFHCPVGCLKCDFHFLDAAMVDSHIFTAFHNTNGFRMCVYFTIFSVTFYLEIVWVLVEKEKQKLIAKIALSSYFAVVVAAGGSCGECAYNSRLLSPM